MPRYLAGFGPRMSRAVTASVVCGARRSGRGFMGLGIRGFRDEGFGWFRGLGIRALGCSV